MDLINTFKPAIIQNLTHVTAPSVFVPANAAKKILLVGNQSTWIIDLLTWLKTNLENKDLVLYSINFNEIEQNFDYLSWLEIMSKSVDHTIACFDQTLVEQNILMFALSNITKKSWFWTLTTSDFQSTTQLHTLEFLINNYSPNQLQKDPKYCLIKILEL